MHIYHASPFCVFFFQHNGFKYFLKTKLTFTRLWLLNSILSCLGDLEKFEIVALQKFIYIRFHKGFTSFKRCCPMTVRSISSYSITASCSKLLHIISNLQWEIWRPPIVKIRDPFCPHCLTPFYASFSNQGSIKETCMFLY